MNETESLKDTTNRSNDDNGSFELLNNELVAGSHELASIKHKPENPVAHAFTNAANLTSKLTSDLIKKMSEGSKNKKKNKENIKSAALALTQSTTDNSNRQVDDSIADNISCMCDNHPGKDLINKDFNIPVDDMFKLLFTTDSEFIRKFWSYRKLESVQVTDWCENKRKMEYAINFGGAFGQVKNFEDIRILRQREKQLYVIESESSTSGVMYADYFSVTTRFCITRRNATTSNLLIKTVIDYKKQPNFIAKSFIEKNTDKAMKDCFSYLEKIIQEESSKYMGQRARGRSVRKNSILLTTSQTSSSSLSSLPEHDTTLTVVNFEFMYWQIDQKLLLKCLLLVFVVLMLFNIRLYLKLSSTESLITSATTNNQNVLQGYMECQKTKEKDSQQVRILLAHTLDTLKSMQQTFQEWDKLLNSSE